MFTFYFIGFIGGNYEIFDEWICIHQIQIQKGGDHETHEKIGSFSGSGNGCVF